MNIASLMNPPRKNAQDTSTHLTTLVRVQATVLAQGALTVAKDQVKSFRHMLDVLTGAYAQARP
ncbi:hypothetical protein OWM54_29730 [Myxococcus sp. MISCRS1]|jgi:hypothetical protein|uniref:Uncharacterized protein n=1 Tax=Myxococcus fulvus TaxID=33 RepID=A0A511SXZ8_MYXFU|nr:MULTISPECIES: hypothetical protein [Myxococcus]AKF86854.1 hypothetical protein MFUL124B02_34775 [Myxococcus fulvus 124B02]MBZ4394369.1 hypothetical protein [Myxococcus sp. AS-1-15]MBZ4410463.1 hypothetical protein [Myxococcus sp. XM-1-1-1]MCK8502962.1 hypothetical protein [Myxococcus fulvus]MCY1001338.1 hypothetical protein [Myxococcus sp. MISCRS1]